MTGTLRSFVKDQKRANSNLVGVFLPNNGAKSAELSVLKVKKTRTQK